ncbi:type II toxin-antitoxin system VapC family toxin [Candidatus Margulisiibacteriota bacterium]
MLVDSCGWLEYFTDGKLAGQFYKYLKDPEEVITSTLVMYEIYKKIKNERSEEDAIHAIARLQETEVVPVSQSITLWAADLSTEYKIPMADAIIYATALSNNVEVVTSDQHFKHLPEVVYLGK